jgi:hypothetical protein
MTDLTTEDTEDTETEEEMDGTEKDPEQSGTQSQLDLDFVLLTSRFFAGREDSVGPDSHGDVVVVDLDLAERNVNTSRTMGSTAIMAAWSAGSLVWWWSTAGPSRTRSTTRTRTFSGYANGPVRREALGCGRSPLCVLCVLCGESPLHLPTPAPAASTTEAGA